MHHETGESRNYLTHRLGQLAEIWGFTVILALFNTYPGRSQESNRMHRELDPP